MDGKQAGQELLRLLHSNHSAPNESFDGKLAGKELLNLLRGSSAAQQARCYLLDLIRSMPDRRKGGATEELSTTTGGYDDDGHTTSESSSDDESSTYCPNSRQAFVTPLFMQAPDPNTVPIPEFGRP